MSKSTRKSNSKPAAESEPQNPEPEFVHIPARFIKPSLKIDITLPPLVEQFMMEAERFTDADEFPMHTWAEIYVAAGFIAFCEMSRSDPAKAIAAFATALNAKCMLSDSEMAVETGEAAVKEFGSISPDKEMVKKFCQDANAMNLPVIPAEAAPIRRGERAWARRPDLLVHPAARDRRQARGSGD